MITLGLDNDQLLKEVGKSQKEIENIGKTAKQAAKEIEEAFIKMDGSNVEKVLHQLESGMTASIEKLKQFKAQNAKAMKTLEADISKMATGTPTSEAEQQRTNAMKVTLLMRKELEKAINTSISAQTQEAEKVKETGQVYQTTATKIRLLKQEMNELRQEGRQDTDYYRQLQKEAEELGESWKRTGAEISVLSMRHPTMQGVVQGIGGLAGAFSTAQGAMALFGSESEDMQRVMVKLQGAMAVTVGLQQLQTLLDRESVFQMTVGNKARELRNVLTGKSAVITTADTVAVVANTTAMTAGARAATGLAGAFKLVGNAIKSIPVFGWIVAALGVVISVIGKLRKMMYAQSEENKRFAEQARELNEKITDSVGGVIQKINSLSQAWGKLTSQKDKQAFIKSQQKAFKELGVSVQTVADAEELLIKNKDRFINAQIAKATANLLTQSDTYKELLTNYIEAQRNLKKTQIVYDEDVLLPGGGKIPKGTVYNPSEIADNELIRRHTPTARKYGGIDSPFNEENIERNKTWLAAVDRALFELQAYQSEIDAYTQQATNLMSVFNTDTEDTPKKTEKKVEQQAKVYDFEEKMLQNRIAYLSAYFDALKSQLDEDNVAGLKTVTDTALSELGKAYDDLYAVQSQRLLAEHQRTLKEIQDSNRSDEEKYSLQVQASGKYLSDRQLLKQNLDKSRQGITQDYDRAAAERLKEETELYRKLLAEYGTYAEQKKAIDKRYNDEKALLDKQLDKAQTEDEKRNINAAKKRLEAVYNQSIKQLSSEYLKSIFDKAFDPEATQETIKEALSDLQELDSDTYNKDWLDKYGLSEEAWEEVKAAIKGVKDELQGKTDKIPLLDKIEQVRQAFEKNGINAGMKAFIGLAGEAVQKFSELADTIAEIAEYSNNGKLSELAEAFQGMATVAGSAIKGAETGSSFGPYGALIGAIGGGLISMFKLEAEGDKQAEEEREKLRGELENAIGDLTQTLYSTISSLDSLTGTIAGLDYTNFTAAIQELINSINKEESAYDNEKYWKNIYDAFANLAAPWENAIKEGLITAEWQGNYNKYRANFGDRKGELIGSDSEDMANYINGIKAEHIRRLNLLKEELAALKENGTAMEIFNKTQEIYMEQYRALLDDLDIAKIMGYDTTEIEAALADLEIKLQNNIRAMTEAYLGQDVAGIVNDWISIFDEFGTSGKLAFDKINQSIDKMVANLLKQKIVIEPLTRMIDDIMRNATDENGDVNVNSVLAAADRLRGKIDDAADLYGQFVDELRERGLNIGDTTSGNSFSQAVKGVSEEKASIIAGQMNAIRVHQIEIQELLQGNIQSNIELIAQNTSVLPRMQADLADVKQEIRNQNNNYTNRIS